jgi:hypothetical protein
MISVSSCSRWRPSLVTIHCVDEGWTYRLDGSVAYRHTLLGLKLHACGTKEELARCLLALHNLWKSVKLHLYDVIQNMGYPIGKEFPFLSYY